MKCNHCTEEATMRCRKHGGHLCGNSIYCTNLHRRNGGDCEMVAPRRLDWTKLLLHLGGLAIGITGLAICWAHFGRIR